MEFVVNRSLISYCEVASEIELMDDPMEPPKEVLLGKPVVSTDMLSASVSDGGRVIARGLHRCTPGKYRDHVDDNEFFTVLCGRATVEVTCLKNPDDVLTLELAEGTVGELRKGSEVIYTVHETLLKSFQLTMSEEEEEEVVDDVKREADVQSNHDFASQSYAVNSSSVPLQQEDMEEGLSWASSNPPPVVTSTLLSTTDGGRVMRGLWRCEAGSCTYVEQDELFTVLQGKATVVVKKVSKGGDTEKEEADSSGERTLVLSRGMVGEFKQGDVATFSVEGDEAFLKSFQITSVTESEEEGK